MAESDPFKLLIAASVTIITLTAVVLVGIAIIGGFKDTGLIDNTIADQFTTGLGLFGAFVGVIVLGIIGKVLVGMFRKGL